MRLSFVAAVIAAAPLAALAQFKCVDAGGRTTFQQTPCAADQRQQPVKVYAAPPQAPASGSAAPTGSVEQRMMARYTVERRVAELERAISGIELDISNRNVVMSNEMEATRRRKAFANNNLAGATYEQSLSTEMQAIATKYRAMNEADFERLKMLRVELDAARKAAGQQQRQ